MYAVTVISVSHDWYLLVLQYAVYAFFEITDISAGYNMSTYDRFKKPFSSTDSFILSFL